MGNSWGGDLWDSIKNSLSDVWGSGIDWIGGLFEGNADLGIPTNAYQIGDTAVYEYNSVANIRI